MKLDYEMITWIYFFIGSIICCFGGFIVGKTLLYKSFNHIKKIRLLLLIPCAIFTIFNSLLSDTIFKLIGVLLLDSLIYKFIFEERGSKVLIYSVVTIIIMAFAEIIYALGISLFDFIFHYSVTSIIAKTIYTNIVIAVFSYIITLILRNKLLKYIEIIKNKKSVVILLQITLTLLIVVASLNFLYIDHFIFSYKFILILIVIFGSSILTLSLIKEYVQNKEVIMKHKVLQEYLKTSADLVEEYSTSVHRSENNLIAIRGYLKYGKIEEANNYIDNLLKNIKNYKYRWVSKINYITYEPIRYMIYHKLSQAEESNLKIKVNVAKDINKLDLDSYININDIDLILDIIGEYFDNAIYASKESEKKEIIFDSYLENNKLIFVISNTFKNNIDLKLINKNGYTTKGKGHGLGLYDIDKIIKSLDILSNEYKIIDNYFMAKLIISIKKTNCKK